MYPVTEICKEIKGSVKELNVTGHNRKRFILTSPVWRIGLIWETEIHLTTYFYMEVVLELNRCFLYSTLNNACLACK